jgi:hypothetical protein
MKVASITVTAMIHGLMGRGLRGSALPAGPAHYLA